MMVLDSLQLRTIMMMNTYDESSGGVRLAAIDLDGTLLGPDLGISEENRGAIERLASAGIEVVLASGRHYRSMRPYVRQLPQVRWIVSSQGAEVARADRSSIVAQKFLRDADVRSLIDAESRRDFTAVYYTADEVFTAARANGDLDAYASMSNPVPVHASHAELLGMQVQKVLWLGEPRAVAGLRVDEGLAALGLQGVQTVDCVYEFMPVETTKATALEILSASLGMGRGNVVAFGDGENDIPMFDWAGLSYAMPHGWENALSRATHVAPPGPPQTAFARAVEELLG
ncbi:Cof-type HAD-IIB family hydrolase [Luteolibacter arcticus]|uniref:Cof-type HAD-IIB family hydrolase n=1 Tax=Luteolibacter arcticus TaxID=1581411 RepID=A0ABT3GSY7_9BACT|nr:HAD family hydrolase [Luteolibacter arcticus]MCW1926638.1 Cof-type HAD-IIB family hydrolase [Luteolibacter arcticus]